MRQLITGMFVLIAFPTMVNAQFTITLNPTENMSQDAIDGFRRAGDFWESVLDDDMNVNLDIDFRELGFGILGQAGSTTQDTNVSDYYTALGGDITSLDDAAAVGGLSGLDGNGALSFRTQVNTEGRSTAISLDNDGSFNNRVLDLNTANAKALGLFSGSADTADASITFSSRFLWDFDQADGVDSGRQDFVGVAVHEIGHALGFVSGVDTVDVVIEFFGDDLDDESVFSGLDMFRYSTDDGILDLSVGEDSYLSLDGGATNLGLFSTGGFNGDGQQASHWKDNLGLGIMDPTANPAGSINVVSDLDLMALDVIGYNLTINAVPEPSSAMILGGIIAFGLLKRRRV